MRSFPPIQRDRLEVTVGEMAGIKARKWNVAPGTFMSVNDAKSNVTEAI